MGQRTRKAFVLVLLTAMVLAGGCKRRYSQATPDDVLASARRMMADGDANRLTDLLWADTPEMKEIYRRIGVMLGHLADLGKEIEKTYPDEVATLKKQAEQAAKDGKASSFLSSMMGGRRGRGNRDGEGGRGRGRGGGGGGGGMERMRDAVMRLFADPYGWIEDNADRLSTEPISDDMAAILLDGKPVPPVGLTMKLEDGAWYVVPPTQVLSWTNALPRTREEYSIVAAGIKVFDNALVDLRKEIKAGEHKDLESVASRAGRMIGPPAMLIGIAYGHALDARDEEDQKNDGG